MKPEERLDRIEANLERFEVAMEQSLHEHELRIRQLTRLQATLMESQNDAWEAIDRTTRNLDRLIGFRGGNGAPQ